MLEQMKDPSIKRWHVNATEGVGEENSEFHTESGVLYRRYRGRKGKVANQLVLPHSYRAEQLQTAHINDEGEHLGVRRTQLRLTENFYWAGCLDDVDRYVTLCATCKREKAAARHSEFGKE